MHENKSFGFEVQDYRIGGLIMRIQHLIKRLKDFSTGKVDKIAELDEVVLNPYPKLAEDGLHNSFEKTVTASILSW